MLYYLCVRETSLIEKNMINPVVGSPLVATPKHSADIKSYIQNAENPAECAMVFLMASNYWKMRVDEENPGCKSVPQAEVVR